MNYLFGWAIKDGSLPPDVGRLVTHAGLACKSNGPSRDHNDLLRAFAAQYRLNRDDVISNACRFYWKKRDKETIIVSPVRKLDADWVEAHRAEFAALLKSVFEKRVSRRHG